jgi:SpoVK/Ycf46/Vps4 family AAA+-type ATPase
VLGATNHPWDVDAALLRPGRFDRVALVLPPDRPARVAILEHHLKGKPVQGVDVDRLAGRTEDFSGADLAHLCDTAVEYALEESLAGAAIRSVASRDFERALTEVRPSTRAWFETARNFVLFANSGGMYDELQAYMRARRLL